MKESIANLKDNNIQVKQFLELLNYISKYSLDQYVEDSYLSIPPDKNDLIDKLDKLIDIAPLCYRENGEIIKDKDLYSKDEYKDNINFLKWLEEYIRSCNKPYSDLDFLREFDIQNFEKLSQFCIDDMILKVEPKEILNQAEWDNMQIYKTRNAMLYVAKLMLCKYYSDVYLENEVKKIFGIDNEKCSVWIKMIRNAEDKIWRLLLMQRIDKIEERLEKELVDY